MQAVKAIGIFTCMTLATLLTNTDYQANGKPLLPVSLDEKISELKEAGSLSKLCSLEGNKIRECEIAIGEWKPRDLENAKSYAATCFDQCMLDVFGFYRDTNSGRDIPAVRTKDFDGTAPSRGFEATFYPVALKVFRYEGCAGCELIYQYPTKLIAEYGGKSYEMPILARGGYYIPSGLRKAIANDPGKELTLKATISEGEHNVNISNKTVKEYSRLLTVLKYDLVY